MRRTAEKWPRGLSSIQYLSHEGTNQDAPPGAQLGHRLYLDTDIFGPANQDRGARFNIISRGSPGSSGTGPARSGAMETVAPQPQPSRSRTGRPAKGIRPDCGNPRPSYCTLQLTGYYILPFDAGRGSLLQKRVPRRLRADQDLEMTRSRGHLPDCYFVQALGWSDDPGLQPLFVCRLSRLKGGPWTMGGNPVCITPVYEIGTTAQSASA
jgi:hypothetical protein